LLNGIRECGNRDGSILHSCFDVWWHWHMIHRIQSCYTDLNISRLVFLLFSLSLGWNVVFQYWDHAMSSTG
jgi:hypothetical protein